MGNCTFKGVTDTAKAKGFNFIRIMTDSGEILKLKGPKLVGDVLEEFPGYKLCEKGRLSSPLLDHQELLGGQIYYLLPAAAAAEEEQAVATATKEEELGCECGDEGRKEDEKEPVRMSSAAAMEMVTSLANGPALEVLPPPQKGVWKVKLAITPRQLEEILSEEVNTEALIEQMRMAAAAASGSGSLTPRRSKISWGLILKPILGNVLKPPPIQPEDEIEPMNFFKRSPIKSF